MRRTSVVLIALALSACSSDSGTEPTPDPINPAYLRLEIVSGAHQAARIGGGPAASLVRVPGLSLDELPEGLLPEPLVARIVDTEGQGVQMSSVAADVIVVTYRVIQPTGLPAGDPRHCGASFVDSQVPDAQGYVTTYWEEPTIADYDCEMQVRLVVDDVPRIDSVFRSRMDPGEPHRIEAPELVRMVEGDTSRAVRGVWDRHGNSVASDLVVRGDAASAGDFYALIGTAWGLSEYDLIVADTAVATGTVAVLPRITGTEAWVWELACQTPDTLYVDRIEGWALLGLRWRESTDATYLQRIMDAMDGAGLDPDITAVLDVYGPARTLMAGSDTLPPSWQSGVHHHWSPGLWLVSAGSMDLVHAYGSATRWVDYRNSQVDSIPARLPLVSTEPLTWQSTDAAAACRSDGWTSTTTGTLTIRRAD